MKYITLAVFIVISCNTFSQTYESDYYSSAKDLTGYELKTALHTIIKNHTSQGYGSLWGFYSNYEKDKYYEKDGSIMDMYSENPNGKDSYNFIVGTDQCGTYKVEGDCYNREHSFPRSWFGGKIDPMNSDVHHIFPTDGFVNGKRGSYPFGEVESATFTSKNGSKKGACAKETGYTGTVFEPIDEFKGDFARAQFYMATRYEDKAAGWGNNSPSLNGTKDQVFEKWALNILIKWHLNDPVSQKETDRNNAAFDYQGNRNPFVDHPEFVECIWNNKCNDKPDTIHTDTCIKAFFPSSKENPAWYEAAFMNEDSADYTSHSYLIYRLVGDTTINQQTYSKLIKLNSPNTLIHNSEYTGAIRTTECGTTYYIPKDGKETVLYNFSKNKGDTVYSDFLNDSYGINRYVITKVDSVELKEIGYRKRMHVASSNLSAIWIEGIGSTFGLLWPLLPESCCKQGRMLVCNYQFNKFAYKASKWKGECFYETSVSDVTEHRPADIIKIFPQPADKIFQINNPNKAFDFSIINQTGQKIADLGNETYYSINAEAWAPGIYFLIGKRNKDNISFTRKILIY